MLKHGAEHHTGILDAIIRNLELSLLKQLSANTLTSLGPNVPVPQTAHRLA